MAGPPPKSDDDTTALVNSILAQAERFTNPPPFQKVKVVVKDSNQPKTEVFDFEYPSSSVAVATRDTSHLAHLGEGAPAPRPWFPMYRVVYSERRAAQGLPAWKAQARVWFVFWADISGRKTSTDQMVAETPKKNPSIDNPISVYWQTREEATALANQMKAWRSHKEITHPL